ncbi:MAG: hypothetical protein JWN51_3534 [Phycisphaerales bacterium]|nr:hypothetical protein [Phycisphaerales bacterium]
MAKRVNTRFLVILTATIGGIAALVFIGPAVRNRLTHRNFNVAAQLQLTDDLVAKKQYGDAREAINLAFNFDHSNKEVCVKRGDVYNLLTEQDGPDALDTARKCWGLALQIDPAYRPALQRLLDSYVDQMEDSPSPQVFVALRDAADRFRKVDPGNTRAQTYYHIAVLHQWMAGAPKTEAEVRQSLAALEAIQKENVSNAEALLYIARSKAYQVAEAQRAGRPDLGDKLIPEIRNMLDAASAARPNDPTLNYRIFLGYTMLGSIDSPEAAKKARELATAALDRARQFVRMDGPHYSEIQYISAEWARQNRKPKEAEEILRANYEARETDQRARYEYARSLGETGDMAKREKAMEILKLPAIPGGKRGVEGRRFKEYAAQSLMYLTRLRVMTCEITADPNKHAELLTQIEDDFKKLNFIAEANSWPVLWLEGSIYRLKHQDMEAIEALGKALAVAPKSNERFRIMYELARSYRETTQNVKAETLLSQIVENYDLFWPARYELVRLYLADNKFEEAARHVDALARLQPDNVEVIRLQIEVMNGLHKPEEAKKFYARLPETTLEAKFSKAQSAVNLQDFTETARLLELIAREKPEDTGIALALAQAYIKLDQKPKAKELVGAALKRNHDDPRLGVLAKQLENASQEDIEKEVRESLSRNPDKFFVEVELGRLELQKSHFDAALAHAQASETLRPDDLATWDLYFQTYLKQRKWDLASKAADNLARIDADHAGGGMYRWQLAMAKNDFSDAIHVGTELTKNRGDYGLSWLLLAQAYEANGQYNDAIDKFRSALERQSNNIEAYRGLADCYEKLSQPERARESIEMGRQRFPQNEELRELALAYDVSVNPAAVIPVRARLLAEAPNEPENYIRLASAYLRAAIKTAPVNPAQATVYSDTGREVLTKGVAKFPTHLRLNGALAESLQDSKRFDDGLKVLTDLAASNEWKDKPNAYVALADYFVHAAKNDEAEKYLRVALEKAEKNKSGYIDIEQRLASLLVRQEKYKDALEVLKAHADDPTIVRLALETHVAARETDLALKGVKEALVKNPDSPELLNLLAGIYIDAKRYPEARETAQKVLAIAPGNDIALYYQALIELRDPAGGKMDLVKKNLSVIVTARSRNVQYKIVYADALVRVKDLAGAALQLEDALKVDPFNREARAKLLDVYTNSRKWSQFEAIAQFAELNPALNRDPLWYRAHAFALAAQRDFPGAIAKIKDAISLGKDDPTFPRDYLNILLDAKDYAEITRVTDSLLAGGHNEWWVHHIRGLARVGEKKKSEALEQFDKAIASADVAKDLEGVHAALVSIATEVSLDEAIKRVNARPATDSRWPLFAVQLNLRMKEWPGAERALAPLLASKDKLSPADRLTAVHFAAEVYQALGQVSKARDYYIEWIALAPNDIPALNNLACLMAEDLKDPKSARQYSQRAYDLSLQSGTVDPLIQDTQGWVMVQCGGSTANDGRRLLETMVDANPSFIDGRYHLGVAYLKAKLPSEAVKQLTLASDALKEQEKNKVAARPQLKAAIEENLRKAQELGGVSAGQGEK